MKRFLLASIVIVFMMACKTPEKTISTAEKAACPSYVKPESVLTASDPFTIESAVIEGKNLMVEVTYGGGCGDAEFTLTWSGILAKSLPPQAPMKLHFADKDHCRAIVTKILCFDISQVNNGQPFTLRLEGVELPLQFE